MTRRGAGGIIPVGVGEKGVGKRGEGRNVKEESGWIKLRKITKREKDNRRKLIVKESGKTGNRKWENPKNKKLTKNRTFLLN